MSEKWRVFVRSWWKKGPSGRYEPYVGRKTVLRYVYSRADAVAACTAYNDTHNPGVLGRMAEFERVR